MRKKVKSLNRNPELEPDYKNEIKNYSIIAVVNSSQNTKLIEAVNQIINFSESYHLKDIDFEDEGFTIFANITIDNPNYTLLGNFDKLRSYFYKKGDIFYSEQENFFETMASIFKPN